ncbi:MAG: sialate O-acetylesterase [Phycisphaeraceae bacterium]
MNRIVLVLVAWLLAGPPALAEVELASVFGDHMVLQRDQAVRVWGKAEPGEKVSVQLVALIDGVKDGQLDVVEADRAGDWHVMLAKRGAGGPWRLTIKGDKSKAPIVINDVLFGEVWVASGQSNMAWTVARSANAADEIANSANDQIRMWTAQRTVEPAPAFDVPGAWAVASPKTAAEFSAVAYYFARRLQRELGVPVGVLHASWGGTPVESWTSRPKLEQIDWAKPILERFDDAVKQHPKRLAEYEKAVKQWEKTRNGPANTGEKQGYAKPGFDDGKWQTMTLPQTWEKAGINKDGVVWFRKTIDLPDGWDSQALRLELGPIDDGDTTYVNGSKVGGLDASVGGAWQRERVYTVPKKLVTKGKLTLAVRVVDLTGAGGIWGKPEQMTLSRADGQGEPIALAGDWKYLFAHEINAGNRPVRPPARPFGPDHPHAPAGLYNGMIAPLTPYTIRGVIWYQGESNASRAQQYRKLFPGLIEDWRARWGQGDFPFLFVQLANYRAPTDEVVDHDWAHLRDAQLKTLRRTQNTGMAVTIDIGEANDIHPRNKQDVGDRLARWALVDTYGMQGVVKSGPLFQSVAREQIESKNVVVVGFVISGSGLKVKGDEPLRGFTIAGEDGKFVHADAKIIEQQDAKPSTVMVWSDRVKDPVAVRYAWENNPTEANLVNEEGLPASPFRTDDWKGPTDGRRY